MRAHRYYGLYAGSTEAYQTGYCSAATRTAGVSMSLTQRQLQASGMWSP